MSAKTIRFEEVKAQLLEDPEVKQAYDTLEPAYQIARLRIARGLTQAQLAEMVGTKQPSYCQR
jgi:hypothetical protein